MAKKITTLDEVEEYFEKFSIGKEFTTEDIKKMVHDESGRKHGSIIPSDYCYNITNNGINNYRDYLHLFEQVARGRYKYLGTNYRYNGKVTNKGVVVGEWKNGIYSDI